MSRKTVRIGVVGLGMGRLHAREFAKDERCRLVALADVDQTRLEEAGAEFGVTGLYTDAERMFEQAGLDAVSIAVPNALHCPLTLAALRRGLHVLCEKPMALCTAEAKTMAAAAARADRVLMINFSFRFNQASQAVKRQVEAGALGEIYFGRTVWHRRRGVPAWGSWFSRRELAGGGPLIDLGVHRLDLALWLMGHPEPIAVSGATWAKIAPPEAARRQVPFTVEDLACGMIRFRNGAVLLVEASWNLNVAAPETMVTALYGERGGLVHHNVDGGYEMTAELTAEEHGDFFTKRLEPDPARPATTSYAEFVECLCTGKPPPAPAADGIMVQRILDALYQSAASGREIILE